MPEIKKARIRRISLCPRGANQMPVIYKSEDNTVRFDPIIKADMEQGLLTALVYVPNRPDSQGDWAKSDVIKEMAHSSFLEMEGINVRHKDSVLKPEQAQVVESFIVQKQDPRFSDVKDYSGNPVNAEGSWAVVIKIEDESLRQAYRDGEWNGVSMEGEAFLDTQKEESLLQQFTSLFKGLLGQDNKTSQEGETEMDPKEIAKLVKETTVEVLKENGLLKDTKKEDDKKEKKPAPVFKGEMSDPACVKAHQKALAIWKAETELEDPVELFNQLQKIETEYAEDTEELDEAAGVKKEDSPEVVKLKRELHKAQKASNQSGKKTTTAKEDEGEWDDSMGISKEQADLAADAKNSVKDFYGENE